MTTPPSSRTPPEALLGIATDLRIFNEELQRQARIPAGIASPPFSWAKSVDLIQGWRIPPSEAAAAIKIIKPLYSTEDTISALMASASAGQLRWVLHVRQEKKNGDLGKVVAMFEKSGPAFGHAVSIGVVGRWEFASKMGGLEGMVKWNVPLGVEAGLIYGVVCGLSGKDIFEGLGWKWSGYTNEDP
jgi:hypothetical protein